MVRRLENNDLERAWKEEGIYLGVLTWRLHGKLREFNENPVTG
jgi:hypothetical protein